MYVRPYPNPNGGRWQMSTGGGTRPLWHPTGRELFYYRPPGTMMAVPLEPGATFRPGTPAVPFEGRYPAPSLGRQYSISPDGRRFLMIKDAEAGRAAPLVVVQNRNWVDRAQPRAPAAKP